MPGAPATIPSPVTTITPARSAYRWLRCGSRHVWEINTGFPALAAHVLVLVLDDQDCHAARDRIQSMLADRFEIEHVTLQLEHQSRQLITLDPRPEHQPV
jgi:hypothetical protein